MEQMRLELRLAGFVYCSMHDEDRTEYWGLFGKGFGHLVAWVNLKGDGAVDQFSKALAIAKVEAVLEVCP